MSNWSCDQNVCAIKDLHNYTRWSDGIHETEEIIENAIRHGIGIIGISNHFD